MARFTLRCLLRSLRLCGNAFANPIAHGRGEGARIKLTTTLLVNFTLMDDLKKLIREVPDFPKPGINFYDITTLLKDPEGLRKTVDALAAEYEGTKIDAVIGIEARGFIFAPALAYHLGTGLCPCGNRKSCRPNARDLLRSRIRPGHFGNPSGRDRRRPSRHHRGRLACHRRYRESGVRPGRRTRR